MADDIKKSDDSIDYGDIKIPGVHPVTKTQIKMKT